MSQYTVYVTPAALNEIKNLPGNMRQHIRRQIEALADTPRPSDSKKLKTNTNEPQAWRLRIDRWRIIYLISDEDLVIDVLAVRKRPPYDYGDLTELMESLQ